jgi:hypothetical protein
MNDKKTTNSKSQPEHVVRCGEVMATICLRQSNAGYAYYDFSLGRCWRSMATGKEAHGNSFFNKNEEDLIQAIREASAWIQARLQRVPSQQPAGTCDEGL